MGSEDDQDTVRLTFTQSTVWALAHKCSGLEAAGEKYGGTMTMNVGAKDRSRLCVYGVLPLTLLPIAQHMCSQNMPQGSTRV